MGKANVNANINNETPLMVAMKLEKLEIFNLLINSHANVNQEIDDSGHTLIWRALWQNKMDFFSLNISRNRLSLYSLFKVGYFEKFFVFFSSMYFPPL